jgi:uncharacterized damage-inducible protein DinB
MTKEQIISEIDIVKNTLIEAINKLSEAEFCVEKKTTWNAAQHSEHLINSIAPLNNALLLPKFFFRYGFGLPNRPSRNYDALVARYLEKLEGNPFPNGNPFGPNQKRKPTKKNLLERLEKQYNKLQKKVIKWDNAQLDQYLLPHPLLGKITVREMLMFTCYHSRHHIKGIEA